MYVDVAVCLPLSRTFVYRTEEPIEIGSRVVVSFRKREVEGFVVRVRQDKPDREVHPILSVIDQAPLMRSEIFELCRWISEYYVSPFGEVLKGALPPGILPKHVGASEAQARQPAASSNDRPFLKNAPNFSKTGGDTPPLQLTIDQSRALDVIRNAHGFSVVLLHGVTGSGKTEVYMRAAAHFLAAGKSSLILVPEIGLTPQLTDRFSELFPGKVAILHSSLTKRQRIDEWLRIYTGEAPIVVGTRSAVFAPLRNLGMIVVDEEHETSYKQEEVPRYNARDTAVMRAKLARAAAVLGSATPSMETFRNAEAKKYTQVDLKTRVEDRALPNVEIVNMREEYVA